MNVCETFIVKPVEPEVFLMPHAQVCVLTGARAHCRDGETGTDCAPAAAAGARSVSITRTGPGWTCCF